MFTFYHLTCKFHDIYFEMIHFIIKQKSPNGEWTSQSFKRAHSLLTFNVGLASK